MSGQWFSPVKTAGLLAVALLLVAGEAQAQQNSLIFPWNRGYQSAPPNIPQEQYLTQPLYPTLEPTVAPAITAPAVPPGLAIGEEEQEEALNDSGRAFITIRVPVNAEIWFEGDRTQQTGTSREFVSPPLDRGRTFTYDVRARWTDNNGKVMEKTEKVTVEAGRRSRVDFLTSAAAPSKTNADLKK